MLAVHLTDTVILVNGDLHGNLTDVPIHILAFFIFSYAWITAIKTNKFSTALFYTIMWVLFFNVINSSLDSLNPTKHSTPDSLNHSKYLTPRAAWLSYTDSESMKNIQNS